jgi:hypothetical protein
VTRFQTVVGGIVIALWAGMYVAASAIDRTLEPLAQSLTPVALVFVGFLFGQAGLKILKGDSNGKGSDEKDS